MHALLSNNLLRSRSLCQQLRAHYRFINSKILLNFFSCTSLSHALYCFSINLLTRWATRKKKWVRREKTKILIMKIVNVNTILYLIISYIVVSYKVDDDCLCAQNIPLLSTWEKVMVIGMLWKCLINIQKSPKSECNGSFVSMM